MDYMLHHGPKEVDGILVSGEFFINTPRHNSLENFSLDYEIQQNEAHGLLLGIRKAEFIGKMPQRYLLGKEKGVVTEHLHKAPTQPS